jgi:Tfp pilus assembly protein PilE
MTISSHFENTTPTMERLGQIQEQILGANREAAEAYLDAYEKTLEQIASYQEQAASETDIDWIATVSKAQAKFTRELARRQVSVGREFLK